MKFGTWEDSLHWNLGILGCPNKAVSLDEVRQESWIWAEAVCAAQLDGTGSSDHRGLRSHQSSEKLSTCSRVLPPFYHWRMELSAVRWAQFWTWYCGCKCVTKREQQGFLPSLKLGTRDKSCNSSAEMWSHNLKISLVQSFGEHYHNYDK